MELKGGYDGAERRIAVFGSEELCHWVEEPPIVCVKISPVAQKFADKLIHRDFLGSLMALGIRREVMGDIVICDNCGYLFCLESIADYIISELVSVRKTTVSCSISDFPETILTPPPIKELVVASERLDAVIAAVYKISRSESQSLISGGKVFLSGKLCLSSSEQIDDGTIVSVRGMGRFSYEGIERETKKGKLRVSVRVY
jgi:RNA-binding protein YlmH